MSRYKGRASAKAIEKDFLHHVTLSCRSADSARWMQMNEFHTQPGIKSQRGQGRHDANGAVVRWCFADKWTAEAFAQKFGVR